MNERSYFILTGVLFVIVSLLHLWRAVNGLPLIVGSFELPVWLSWLAFVLIGLLSIWAFRLFKKN